MRILSLLLLCISMTLSPLSGISQEVHTPDPDVLTDSTSQRLLRSYLANQKHVKVLLEELDNLAGNQKQALENRILKKQIRGLRTIEQLSDALYQDQKQGQDISASLKELSPIFLNLGPRIIQALKNEEVQYTKIADMAEEPTMEGLRMYLDHISRMSAGFSAVTDIYFKNKQLDLDDGVSEAFLKEALVTRAETFIGLLDLNTIQQSEFDRLLALAPDNADIKLQKDTLIQRASLTIDHFRQNNRLMSRLGLNINAYQQYIISISGEITTDMLDLRIVSSFLKKWGNGAVNYFADNGVEMMFKLFIFTGVLFGFKLLSKGVQKVLHRSLDNSSLNFSSLMKDMVVSIVARGVMIMGILIALSQLGISLGPLLAGLGVAGFIIGFALQDTLGNFASGMMILIYRPYDVKDMVEAAGVFGEVKSMNLVSTTILTIDNQTLVIPNSKIWGDVIKNVTAQRLRRVDMVFGIGYSDDVEKAEKVFMSILEEHESVLSKPAPTVKLHTLNESSVDFIVRPWVKTDDYWDVYWDVTREVKMRLDREGISIPFPQRDVHVYEERLMAKPAE